MANNKYLTAPLPSEKMPSGIPHILTQETFERFSFYGMRSILVLFMTQYLIGPEGTLGAIPDEKAKEYFHLFVAFTYFMPIIGAAVSDTFLGKFKTIMIFSIINCLGLLALVVDQTRTGLMAGLVLIAIGSGFIKPCVSANVGDQFGKHNKHLLQKVYGWFYFVINFGSFFSYMLIPILIDKFSPANGYSPHTGPRIAFGVPAASMLLATLAFWMGRKRFVHAPPSGLFHIKNTLKGEGLKVLGRLGVLFVFIAMFWALFCQMDSSWFLQATNMDRVIKVPEFIHRQAEWIPEKFELLAAQIGAANPLIVMALIPLFSFGIYPAMNKVFRVTPLRRISIGMFVAALAFAIPAWNETRIGAGLNPHIVWLIFAVLVLTIAEVMVSITVLEFAYTQAPKAMKSLIMSVTSLSIFLGNIFASWVNRFIYVEDGPSKLEGASYFWFFAGAMLLTAVVFVPFAASYKEHNYIHEEKPAS